MPRPRPQWISWLLLCVAGAALGALGVYVDEFIAHSAEWTSLTAPLYLLLRKLGNAGPAWVLLAVVASYVSSRPHPPSRRSVRSAVVFLLAAVSTYYLLNVLFGFREIAGSFVAAVIGWIAIALVAGVVAGFTAAWLGSGNATKEWWAVLLVLLLAGLDVVAYAYGFRGSPLQVSASVVAVVYAVTAVTLTRLAVGRWKPVLTAGGVAAAISLVIVSMNRVPLIDRIIDWLGVGTW